MKYNELRNKDKDILMKNNYRYWKLSALDEAGYFIIFQGFMEDDILKKISGNALKLYIYLGINSNNFEGIVWHSNKTISNYFNKSERTIRGWMKELEDLNLIKRMRLRYDGEVVTYLQPYKYKLNKKDKNLNYVNGVLFMDEVGHIYIKTENTSIPLIRSMYLEIFDEVSKEWKEGKIEMRKYLLEQNNNDIIYNFKIIYKFKSFDKKFDINLNTTNKLKVRFCL